nr:Rid family hydrolase [Euzebya tangerina]
MWSHAVEVSAPNRTVYVAGTMGLHPNGEAPADLDEQLRLVWSNIARILSAATCPWTTSFG